MAIHALIAAFLAGSNERSLRSHVFDEISTVRPDRLLRRLSRGAVANVRFDELTRLVERLGFGLKRVSGSHHIYVHPEIPDILVLQAVRGEAKPYQVRQLILLVEEYDMKIEGP